jgi:hypothetical protein
VPDRTGPKEEQMQDMERKDDETEVEGHASTADVNSEQIQQDDENEFEAHIRVPNIRMDSPSNT